MSFQLVLYDDLYSTIDSTIQYNSSLDYNTIFIHF